MFNNRNKSRQAKWELKQYKKTAPFVIESCPSTIGILILLGVALAPVAAAQLNAHHTAGSRTQPNNGTSQKVTNNSYSMQTPDSEYHTGASHPVDQSALATANIHTKPKTRADYIKQHLEIETTDDLIRKKIIATISPPANVLNKSIKMIVDAIQSIRLEKEDRDYIDFVLKHPSFCLKIEAADQTRNGAYNPYTNCIKIPISTLSNGALITTLRHEFWHAYHTLAGLNFADPKQFSTQALLQSGKPYYESCDTNENARLKKALATAIDQDDKAIMDEFAKGRVEPEKFKDYEPERQIGKINARNFSVHQSAIENAIAQGKSYEYTFYRDGHPLSIFVDNYKKLPDGAAIIEGYSCKDPKDKAAAYIGDLHMRKYNLAATYSAADQPFDEFVERDAFEQQNPPKLRKKFKNRANFHSEQKKDFKKRMENLPYDGPEVVEEIHRCRGK